MIRLSKSVGIFGILALVGAAGCALDGHDAPTPSPTAAPAEGTAVARGNALTLRLPESFRGALQDVRVVRSRVNDAGDDVVFESVLTSVRAGEGDRVVELTTVAPLDEGEVLTLSSATDASSAPSTLRVRVAAAPKGAPSLAGGALAPQGLNLPGLGLDLPLLTGFRLLSLKDDDGHALVDGHTISRDARWVDATFGSIFASEKVDCAHVALSRSTFELYTAEPTSARQQAMYHNASAPRVGGAGYRGSLECDSNKNRLRFNLPGVLLGGAVIKLNLGPVKSTDGNVTDRGIVTFTTQNPGIKVQMNRVEGYLGKMDPAGPFHSYRRDADLYMGMFAATVNENDDIVTSDSASFMNSSVVKKIPTGFSDWANMNQGETRIPDQPLIFWTARPIGQTLAFYFQARDSDGNDSLQKAVAFVRDTHDQAAVVLAAFGQAPYAAMAREGKKTWNDILGLLKSNGDDYIGNSLVLFDKQDARWGVDWKPTTSDDRDFGRAFTMHGEHGSVVMRMTTEEYPRSW